MWLSDVCLTTVDILPTLEVDVVKYDWVVCVLPQWAYCQPLRMMWSCVTEWCVSFDSGQAYCALWRMMWSNVTDWCVSCHSGVTVEDDVVQCDRVVCFFWQRAYCLLWRRRRQRQKKMRVLPPSWKMRKKVCLFGPGFTCGGDLVSQVFCWIWSNSSQEDWKGKTNKQTKNPRMVMKTQVCIKYAMSGYSIKWYECVCQVPQSAQRVCLMLQWLWVRVGYCSLCEGMLQSLYLSVWCCSHCKCLCNAAVTVSVSVMLQSL